MVRISEGKGYLSKHLLNKWLEYGSKRVKQYGKLEFTTVPVILPVIVFFLYLLAELSSLCIWILHKEKLVHCVDVVFILSLYPMMVTCISEVIFNAVFWRQQTQQWYNLLHSLYIVPSPMQNTRFNK